jgi:hypothetical protein
MHRRTLFAAIAPFAALVLTAAAPATKPGDERLIPRIHAHFDSVLAELRAADVRGLNATQLERRVTLIGRLERYRDRGVFPHNYDFAGQMVPYFIDRKTGTLCAVAHLVASTGRRDIVNRVAAMNNNVWVMQLKGDAAFETWLREHGLTLDEAARIQLPYEMVTVEPAAQRSSAAPLFAASAGAIAAMNLATNADGHGRIRNWLGVASGVANIAVGAGLFQVEQRNRRSGLWNVGLGTVSAALTTRAMFRRNSMLAARRDAERAKVAVAPMLPTSESGAGLSVNIKF